MKIHAGVWRCCYCGTESIHVGSEYGSSNTICPKRCPGRFNLVKEYPLATGLEGIIEAFNEINSLKENGI